jgi:hypothetical protein
LMLLPLHALQRSGPFGPGPCPATRLHRAGGIIESYYDRNAKALMACFLAADVHMFGVPHAYVSKLTIAVERT